MTQITNQKPDSVKFDSVKSNNPCQSVIPTGYKQTEVGVIPVDWEVKKIGDLQPFVTSGSRGWAAFYSDHGSPFIRITNLIRASIYLDLNDLRFVSLPANNSEGARTQLQDCDVLISITADIGIVGYVSEKVPSPSYINQHIALVRFDSSKTNSRFVSYFLASEKPQKHFRALTDSGAKAGMNLTTVKQVQLALPPTKAEQEAIAKALSDTDALIESLEQLISKKRHIKQGAMQKLLTGKKRLPGFSGEWEVKRVKQFGEIVTGGTPLTGIKDFWNGDVPWVTPTDISDRKDIRESERQITTLGLASIRRLPCNTVLVTCIASIGKNAVLRNAGACNQQINAIIPNKEHNADFLYYLIESKKQYLLGNAGITATMIISKRDFSELDFTVPPLPEQTAIATILSDMDAEIAALETKLAKTRQLKQGMMHKLLTGQIRLI